MSLTFSYATPETQAAAALVCQAWLEPALDELWRELEWPGYALQVLAPFDPVTDKIGRVCVCFILQACCWDSNFL